MRKKLSLVLAIVCFTIATIAISGIINEAHAFCMGSGNIMLYPDHSCYEPREPYCFINRDCEQYEIDSYKREIDTYKQCIIDYVDAVNADICNMKQKAQNAIDQWNSFANR